MTMETKLATLASAVEDVFGSGTAILCVVHTRDGKPHRTMFVRAPSKQVAAYMALGAATQLVGIQDFQEALIPQGITVDE